MSNPRQRALRLAVQILKDDACASLGTTPDELNAWLTGFATPPVQVLMRALDVILDDPALAARHAVTLAAEERSLRTARSH